MSPRARAQGISWRLMGPAIGLWLVAVIALSAIASPATASQDSTPRPAQTTEQAARTVSSVPSEAPIVTLIIALLGVASITARPAGRAVARRHTR